MFPPFFPFLKPFCLIVPQPSICRLSTAAVTLLLQPPPPTASPPTATVMLHSSFLIYSATEISERCTLWTWMELRSGFVLVFWGLQFCFSVISTASYWFFVNNLFNIDFSKLLGRSSNTHSQTPETLPYFLLCFFFLLFLLDFLYRTIYEMQTILLVGII